MITEHKTGYDMIDQGHVTLLLDWLFYADVCYKWECLIYSS